MKTAEYLAYSLWRGAMRIHKATLAVILGSIVLGTIPAYAYRTAGDLDEFDGTTRVRWQEGAASFVLVDDIPGGLGSAELNADLIREALRAWAGPACSALGVGLSGVTAADAAYGDNRNSIQWVSRGWEDLGFQKGASGATDIRYEEVDGKWVIAEADVYLNSQAHDWTTGAGGDDKNVTEISGVLTHELGHALGILHPCEEANGAEGSAPECKKESEDEPPTMYPAYSHGQTDLKKDDIDAICFLYPSCSKGSCDAGQTCKQRVCVDDCGEGTCKSDQVCVDEECIDTSDPCYQDPFSCITCEEAKDCGVGFKCEEGACLSFQVPLGDPCEDSAECQSFSCSNAGYCSTFCSQDANCGKDGKCDTETFSCTKDSRQPFAGVCDSADDCLGGACLKDLTDEPVCTRPCEVDGMPCPLDWMCGEADDEVVCVPEAEPFVFVEGGCGCQQVGLSPQLRASASHSNSSSPQKSGTTAALLGALSIYFLRRRRQQRSKNTQRLHG